MLDLLISDRYITATNLKTNASTTLQSFDTKPIWAETILAELQKSFAVHDRKGPSAIIETSVDDLHTVFCAFVGNAKADFALKNQENGEILTTGSAWDRMFSCYAQKSALENEIKFVNVSDEEIAILQKGDLKDPLFTSEEIDAITKKALFLGKITQEEAAKVFIALVSGDRFKGIISNKTKNLHQVILDFFSTLQPLQQEKVERLLRSISEEESQCLIIDGGSSKKNSLYALIGKGSKFPFTRDFDGKLEFLVPPPQLLRRIYRELQESNTMLPNVVSGGLSAPEDFASAVFRPVYVPVPRLESPKMVHDRQADGLSTYIHDAIGHLWVESKQKRIPMILMAQMIKRKDLWNKMLDRDTPTLKSLTISENFWLKMAVVIHSMQHYQPLDKALSAREVIRQFIKHKEIFARHGISPLSDREIEKIQACPKIDANVQNSVETFLRQYVGIHNRNEELAVQEERLNTLICNYSRVAREIQSIKAKREELIKSALQKRLDDFSMLIALNKMFKKHEAVQTTCIEEIQTLSKDILLEKAAKNILET